MERRTEDIEKDIEHQIDLLEDKLRGEISEMTDEQIKQRLTINP